MLSKLFSRARAIFTRCVSRPTQPSSPPMQDAIEPIDKLILCHAKLDGTLADIFDGYLIYPCLTVSGIHCATMLGLNFYPTESQGFDPYEPDYPLLNAFQSTYSCSTSSVDQAHLRYLESLLYIPNCPSPPSSPKAFHHKPLPSSNSHSSQKENAIPTWEKLEAAIRDARRFFPTPENTINTYPSPEVDNALGLHIHPEDEDRFVWPSHANFGDVPQDVRFDDGLDYEHEGERYTESLLVSPHGTHYLVQGILGTGGFGRVFKAKAKLLPHSSSSESNTSESYEYYAIKVMHKSQVYAYEEGREMVLSEGRVLRRITEAKGEFGKGFLVGMVESWADEENVFYVMPLYHTDLAELMFSSSFLFNDPATLKQVAAEIIQAVYNLHELGIIHRDIKPSNILISSDGHVALADFGLAYIHEVPSSGSSSSSPTNRTTTVSDLSQLRLKAPYGGTEAYQPPELIPISSPSPSSSAASSYPYYTSSIDIWSAGLVIYELWMGLDRPYFSKVDDHHEREDEGEWGEVREREGDEWRKQEERKRRERKREERKRKQEERKKSRVIDWDWALNRRGERPGEEGLIDLLQNMLDPNPSTRITLSRAIHHPYFQNSDFDFDFGGCTCKLVSTPSALFPLPPPLPLLPPSPSLYSYPHHHNHHHRCDDEEEGRPKPKPKGLSFRTFWYAKDEKGDGELVKMGKKLDREGRGVYEWVCSSMCVEVEEVDVDVGVDLPEIVIDEDEDEVF